MDRVSARQHINSAGRVEGSEASSSPGHVRHRGFSERSSCCSLNEDSCCGLFGWVCAIWELLCDFWSCIWGCGAPPVNMDEADEQNVAEQVQLGSVIPPSEDVAQIKAFLEKYPESEGVIKADSARGKAYLEEFDSLPIKATNAAMDALINNWPADEAGTGFAVLKEQKPDSRQTLLLGNLVDERLKNNLNSQVVRTALTTWSAGTKLTTSDN